MSFDIEMLSRVQFGLTIAFHYIYPPLSIGLGVMLVIMEGLYLRTGNPMYHRLTRFWVTIFGLIFARGVATGIVMEFEFGTNWSRYSRFVGDVFGSALAAEGLFAFFMESGFLAILVFGWNKVSKGMHFFSTVMVALGAMFSAIWIVVANSWMQTPAGYHLVHAPNGWRAEITDFWAMVFNPSTVDRLSHVISGAWLAGAFLVVSVSAYYLLKNRDLDYAKAGLKIGLVVAAIGLCTQIVTGHSSAVGVAQHQPAKLAAFEGHYEANAPGDLYLFGITDDDAKKTTGIALPGMLSLLVYGDPERPVRGLDSFKPEDRPPVAPTFQAYHLMIAVGMTLFALTFYALFLWWKGKLFETPWILKLLVLSVLGPQIANQAGWFAAEVGRQPWIVYGLMRTRDGLSPNIGGETVLASLILFTVVYILLFLVFIYLLNEKIQKGPEGVLKEPALVPATVDVNEHPHREKHPTAGLANQ